MFRKTYLEIDLDSLKHNITEIRKNFGEYEYYFGVIKANAYGAGIYAAEAMIEAGINYLAVSSLEEALAVREINRDIPVLVMEPICFEGLTVAAKNKITVTVDNADYFDKMLESKLKIKFHIKVDCGMNRFGLTDKNDVKHIVENADENAVLEGVFTQLSSGSGERFKNQLDLFKERTSLIDLKKIKIVHIDRSLTLELHEKIDFANGVRLGIVMYGFGKMPAELSFKRKIINKITGKKPPESSKLSLKNVFRFYTEVLEVKRIKPGESVGYGGMFESKEDGFVAVLPYGFADFSLIGKTCVYIGGRRRDIIVNYMDVTAAAVDSSVKPGDKVEIFGDELSPRAASRQAGVNVYKLITSITNRVPRVYVENGKSNEVKY
ncbi:MAG: alanine racemase [Clostridia bacterium]|nr:alanine racemase [Clostridia bacterium]